MVREKGFSLIELLIVVAIILVIAAIAIPNLVKSRMAANEASAVSGIRAITTAQHAYATAYPDLGYSCSLQSLGPPPSGQPATSTGADILDAVISGGLKAGYSFGISNCTGTPVSNYQSTAVPVTVGGSGQRAFCSDGSGIIQYSNDGSAATCIAGKAVLQ
ncbi:MAG TPA: prepilin-type N-terminal cleavage/methylation domain-containing protein [Terriglobales bacterium]|nr:prepilin-type N-terminal cleavage/methylation domain-containing protein [Terriglobales bacterium]